MTEIPTDPEEIRRDDWNGSDDNCPECDGDRFEMTSYDTEIHEGGQMVNDRWAKQGLLWAKCLGCDTVLHQHPAYPVLEAVETGGEE